MRNKNLIEDLLKSFSPSGDEGLGTEIIKKYITDLEINHHISLKRYSDKIGNYGCILGEGSIKIMLSGHIDEICMTVVNITDDGYLNISNMAGIDRKVLPGSQVVVLGDQGYFKGIVHKHPLHLEGVEEIKNEVKDINYYKIDLGFESREEVENAGVYPGCLIVFARNINTEFGKNKIHGNSLDDKAGVYVVFNLLNTLLENPGNWLNKYTIYFISGVQEESGLRGLTVASHKINPDISIDLDVTFANDAGYVDSNKYGNIKLGKGVVLEYGQDKSRRIARIFKEIGDQQTIPYQIGVSRCGGTNTDAIQLNSFDCETFLLSLPNCNMHSPNEVCDWRDLESAENLLKEAIIQEFL